MLGDEERAMRIDADEVETGECADDLMPRDGPSASASSSKRKSSTSTTTPLAAMKRSKSNSATTTKSTLASSNKKKSSNSASATQLIAAGQRTISSFFAKKDASATITNSVGLTSTKSSLERPNQAVAKGLTKEVSTPPRALESQSSSKPTVTSNKRTAHEDEQPAIFVASSNGAFGVKSGAEDSGSDDPLTNNRARHSHKRARIVDSDEDDFGVDNEIASEKKLGRTTKEIYGYVPGRKHDEENSKKGLSEDRQKIRDRFLKRFKIVERKHDGYVIGGPIDCDDDGVGYEEETKLASKRTPLKRGKDKYTPLELQYLEIKKKHPDCLLVVEVGYKFRFFEEDALTASKELNIVAYMDKNFYAASIPTQRMPVHVKKLVQLGYKVGIVRQMETAAIKASGDNKSKPFDRKLTNIYTRGTFVDDIAADDDGSVFEASKSTFILCIDEAPLAGSLDGERVTISLVAVQLATGDVIYDSFEDGMMRVELETRLHHIRPAEILLPVKLLSEVTERLVKHWACGSGQPGDGVRVERLQNAFLEVSPARTMLLEFYEKMLKSKQSKDANLYSQVLNLPGSILVCLAALLKHLNEYGLELALLLTQSFEPFTRVGHMILGSSTLTQLEIFVPGSVAGRTSTGVGGKGSLLWVLDHTVTKFGGRMLKKWIGRPLVQVDKLNERVGAVEELMKCIREDNMVIKKLKGLLSQLPDLEKSLARVHYGRCSAAELFSLLSAFEKVCTVVPPAAGGGFSSPLLNDIVAALPRIREDAVGFLALLDEAAAKEGNKVDLFLQLDDFPEIAQLKEALLTIDADFLKILNDVRSSMRMPYLEYATVSGVAYQIEIKQKDVNRVPPKWCKVSQTKAVARFHTPEVLEKMKEFELAKEQLAAAAEQGFKRFVAKVALKYDEFRDIIQKLATADCLFSLVRVALQPGYTKPIHCEESVIEVSQGRHPMVEALITNFVPNDIRLNPEERCLLVTGPNMGGKSSYIRQVALIAIMGQIGSYIPADSAKLGIFDSVHTRMGACDDITRGQSTFMKELQETSDIIRQATPRSLVILDELGRGTSTHDGTAIAFATLHHIIERVRCTTLFVTHYPVLGSLAGKVGGAKALRCYHMGFMENEDSTESVPSITFLYKLAPGLADRSYGLNVAKLARLPQSVIDIASTTSRALESQSDDKKGANMLRFRRKVMAELWGSGGERRTVLQEILAVL